MEPTENTINVTSSRLEEGEHLAVRQSLGETETIFLARDLDEALLRIHLNSPGSNGYQVHPPSEFGNLRHLLAQCRSQKSGRPTHLHALLRGEPRHITEFRSQGLWEFRAGQVPISSWEAAVLKDVSSCQFYLGHTATHAMMSAWIDAVGCFGFSKRIDWNGREDAVFTDVMDVLAIAGLIDRRSGEQDTESVTALKFPPFVVAKVSEIALALVESETTAVVADEIISMALRGFCKNIRDMSPSILAQEFATAWHEYHPNTVLEWE